MLKQFISTKVIFLELQKIQPSIFGGVWIGVYYDGDFDKFTDGTPMDFTNWEGTRPVSYDTDSCFDLFFAFGQQAEHNPMVGTWAVSVSPIQLADYVCKKPATRVNPKN